MVFTSMAMHEKNNKFSFLLLRISCTPCPCFPHQCLSKLSSSTRQWRFSPRRCNPKVVSTFSPLSCTASVCGTRVLEPQKGQMIPGWDNKKLVSIQQNFSSHINFPKSVRIQESIKFPQIDLIYKSVNRNFFIMAAYSCH